ASNGMEERQCQEVERDVLAEDLLGDAGRRGVQEEGEGLPLAARTPGENRGQESRRGERDPADRRAHHGAADAHRTQGGAGPDSQRDDDIDRQVQESDYETAEEEKELQRPLGRK